MTNNQLYEQSAKRIKSFDFFNEIVLEIQKITGALTSREIGKWSGDELSRAISKLAVLRVNLGQEMADATAKYDFSYLSRKLRYASEWKPTKESLNATLNKVTVGDIENEVTKKIADVQAAEIENKHYADQLKTLYDSTETLITALQSRLGLLKQEMKETITYKH
jgi:hypothetical protein